MQHRHCAFWQLAHVPEAKSVEPCVPQSRYTSDGHAAYQELVWPEASRYVGALGEEATDASKSLNAYQRISQAACPPQLAFQSLGFRHFGGPSGSLPTTINANA